MSDHYYPTTDSIMMGALSTLSSSQLSSLCVSLSAAFHRHHRHLISLLSSPTLFTHTLNHLYTLSLPQKSLLIARHLFSFLRFLTPYLPPPSSSSASLFTSSSNKVRLRDLDSVLLLLFFCEVRQHQPTLVVEETESPARWQEVLKQYGSDTVLNYNMSAGIAVPLAMSPFQVLGTFVDLVVTCRRFVGSKGCAEAIKREVAASVDAVVALPSVTVEVGGGGVECVICKEEMKEGRDVCELPCDHKFHWKCVLPWLTKRNTCPYCRFMLPTDDVYAEIQRVWDAILKLATQHLCFPTPQVN